MYLYQVSANQDSDFRFIDKTNSEAYVEFKLNCKSPNLRLNYSSEVD